MKYDEKELISELVWNNFNYYYIFDEFFSKIGIMMSYPDVISDKLISVLSFDKLVKLTKYLSDLDVATFTFFSKNQRSKELFFKEKYGLSPALFDVFSDDFEVFYLAVSEINKYWWIMQELVDLSSVDVPDFDSVFWPKFKALIMQIYKKKFATKFDSKSEKELDVIIEKLKLFISSMPKVFLHGNFHAPLVINGTDGILFYNFCGSMIGPVAYDLISLINANSFTSIPRVHETVIIKEFYDDTVSHLHNKQTVEEFFVSYKILEVLKEVINYFIAVTDLPVSDLTESLEQFFNRLCSKNFVIYELKDFWLFFEKIFKIEINEFFV